MPIRSLPVIMLLALSPAAPAIASDASAATAFDALLAKHHKPDAPGCAAAAYRGANLLHAGAFGMANLELQVPITPASAFDIGSTSKQFTAFSALLLARDGKLSLDDDIRKHVPELPVYEAPITLRHLLNHTAGVRDYIDLLRLSGAHDDDVTTAQRALDLLARQKGIHFRPGVRHEYSNSGYFLVALAAERVSGQSMREFAQQRIFEPLQMKHSLYRDDHAELVPNRAMAYSKDEKEGWRLDVSNWEQMGDGGIVTTVQDMAKWNGNFYAPVVGDAAMLQDLHERGILNDGSRINYALGLMHGAYKGHSTIHHGGSWGGYISNLVRFPEHKLGVAVFCNSPDQPLAALIDQIADLYLPVGDKLAATEVAPKRKTITLPVNQLRQWVGTYRSSLTSNVATLRLNKSSLELEYEGATYPLQPIDASTLRVANLPIEVLLVQEPAIAGQPRRIRQIVNGVNEPGLVAFEAATSTTAQLQAIAGRYHCPEVNADYRLEAKATELSLVSPRGNVSTLTQHEQGYFIGRRLNVRIPIDTAGKVSTMTLGTARAQGLLCERR